MPRGQRDFGGTSPTTTIAGVSDMGELAVRLGSPVTFDRRGDVILLDDFEDNINKWVQTHVGVGGAIALSNDTCKNGARSCKFTTGNVIGNACSIERYMSYPVSGRFGFEISFTYESNFSQWEWLLQLNDGAFYHLAEITYVDATGTLYYRDSTPADVAIVAGLSLYEVDELFHTIKLVVDFDNDKYIRLILNNTEYDLSAYSFEKKADATNQRLFTRVRAYTATAANNVMYLDDAIWTQNEP